MKKNVLILFPQVPFVRGGAELLLESLMLNIKKYLPDINVESIKIPFNSHPANKLFDNMMVWRMLELDSFMGHNIDLVISTKFPSYAIKHPNKVLWLIHQFRQVYDLKNTIYGANPQNNQEKRIYSSIQDYDNAYIRECKSIYTISDTVTYRLKHYNDIDSTPLLPPSPMTEYITPGTYGDYFVCISRLSSIKRIDLIVNALAKHKTAKLKIIGTGEDKEKLQALIDTHGISNRCELLGYLSIEELTTVLKNAKGLLYTPVDEDYGYATIEGLLAQKPVITCDDSGEVAAIVKKYNAGIVCKPNASALMKAIDTIDGLSDTALFNMANMGYEFAKNISWKKILTQLVENNL